MNWPIRRCLLALCMTVAAQAQAAIPRSATKAAERQDGVRYFEVDFGEILQLSACRFTMTDAAGAATPLQVAFGRSKGSKVALAVPVHLHGKQVLAWDLLTVAGERLRGAVPMILE